MSLATIARDDFRNVRRSAIVLGVVGILTALVALVFASEIGIHDDPYRVLVDVTFLLFLAFPLLVAPLTYLSIAGERSRGTVKYVLGLPNRRYEYVFGTYLSRGAVAVTAVLTALVVGFGISAVAFTNGPDPVRFGKFAALSVLYTLAITGTFVAISAMTGSRARAMFAVLVAYFVLGPFWLGFLPVVSLEAVLDAVTSALGVTLSESAMTLIQALSPTTAFLESTEIVYIGVFDQYETISQLRSESNALGDQTWFAVLVMVAWATVVPFLGYLRFRRAELG